MAVATEQELITQTVLDRVATVGVTTTRERPLEVRIENVRGASAIVTVRSTVLHEYLRLVRTDDGWEVANALWGVA
jgi:hypothetical protein